MRFLALFICPALLAQSPKLIDAIVQVESGGKNVIGDSGKALGPLQCHYGCWRDAIQYRPEIGGNYNNCTNLAYSKRIFLAYMDRYKKVHKGSEERMAKLWHLGPSFDKRSAKEGDKYWLKVNEAMK